MSRTIAELLKDADIRVDNSLSNADIKQAVAKKGYSEENLLIGKGLVNGARSAIKSQVTFAGNLRTSTALEANCKNEAHRAFQDLAQTARATWPLKSPQLAKLGLSNSEPESTAAFIKAGYILFDNAISDAEITAELAKKGYTVEELSAGRTKIEAYETANKNQVSAIGSAKDSTKQQKDAVKAMNKWISEYTKIAKIALRDNETLLSKIGIIIKKRGPAKKNNKNIKNPPPEGN